MQHGKTIIAGYGGRKAQDRAEIESPGGYASQDKV